MKNLLFIIPTFNHGGTNKSLMHILSSMDRKKYSIDIFAVTNNGPYKKLFSTFNVLHSDLLLASFCGSNVQMKRENSPEKNKKIFLNLLYRILRVLNTSLSKKLLELAYKKASRKIEKMGYDTVIAMQEGSTTHFVSCIRLPKTAWIHCDYNKYFEVVKINEKEIYEKFEQIVCVSEYTKQVFLGYYPALKDKCHAVHNIIDCKGITKMADDPMDVDARFVKNVFSIVSVGRLNKVKQFHIIPEIADWLRNNGCAFRWYIIGGGEERDKILGMIERFNVADTVFLLGEKDNPYPYIKRSDLLVCTSISEACPHAINEAKILHVPVVTTDFGSAPEFIENGVNGIITGKDGLKTAIREMIVNKEKYSNIKEKLFSFEYPNKEIIQKLSGLLQ